jgi:DNA repair protein RecN (Recombination protein N)
VYICGVIKHLYIKNFAIIQEAEIDFQSGLTVITGETGAGKSILLGALSLILGERADAQVIASNNEKCIVEGRFDAEHLHDVTSYLKEHELDVQHELILRREVTTSGKSRAFINDTPVTLTHLSALANHLVDLHRQFDTIELQQQKQQLNLFDEIAGLKKNALDLKNNFNEYLKEKQKFKALEERNKAIKQEQDYNQYLVDEFTKLDLKENELEQLEAELALLSSSEQLKSCLQKAVYDLNESETPLLTQLKVMRQSLEAYSQLSPNIKALTERLDSIWVETKDICSDLEQLAEETHYDPEKINELSERLNEGNKLLKKHHVTSTNELLDIMNSLMAKLNQAISADEEESKLKLAVERKYKEVMLLAEDLAIRRRNAIEEIESKLNKLLPKVGLANASLKLHEDYTELTNTGINEIVFKLDANKSGKYQPIGKAASGGELSRIMLCIKSLQAKSTQMPTLIFDEIDTGISGETAIQLSGMLKELASTHQIICITHLPQIASKGESHLFIYKKENDHGKLITSVKYLNDEERIQALSEMIGGKEANSESVNMIKQLMK